MHDDSPTVQRVENIFAALGVPNPVEEQARVDRASEITIEIRRRDLSPPEAAAALSLTDSEVHAIMNARIADFSRDQLDQILHSFLASSPGGARSGR